MVHARVLLTMWPIVRYDCSDSVCEASLLEALCVPSRGKIACCEGASSSLPHESTPLDADRAGKKGSGKDGGGCAGIC